MQITLQMPTINNTEIIQAKNTFEKHFEMHLTTILLLTTILYV